MGRALRAGVVLIIVCVAVSSWAEAVERELAGVRLGQKALDLLTKPGFGQPDYIGPLATLGTMAPPPGTQTQEQLAPGGGQGGPTGPARRGGAGGRGMRMGQAPASAGSLGVATGPRVGVSLTGRMGGGGRGGGRGMRAGGRGGGGRGGGGRAGGGRAVGGGRARTSAAAGSTEGPGMYWYYGRTADVVLVLTLDRVGVVRAITLSGTFPYRAGRTSRGIGLASTYMDIIAQYGYPDNTAILGTSVQLTYVDHGVRFQLEGMKVREIAIGAYVTAGVAAAPSQTPETVTPPAGLSVEELRGYL